MPLKGLFRGGADRDSGGSEGGSSHGGGRRESLPGGARQERSFVGKMTRALLPNGGKRDRRVSTDRPYFNPEEHISQKREWSRRYTQQEGSGGSYSARGAAADVGAPQPDRLFEHFAVVGLPPTTNVRAVAADIRTSQRYHNREAGRDGTPAGGLQVTADAPGEEAKRQYGIKGPTLQAEVLYTFPGGTSMPADLAHSLAAFCFPHGVRPELLERTPSMSALNEVIYSQPYQTHDDHSFVFLMKVADPRSVAPRTLYGVCCHVRELVHRPPSMAREAYPACNAPLSRYLVVAPRCYCLLTHHPFFALHFRVLQTILGLERLERMTNFAAELAALQLEGVPAGRSGASSATSSQLDGSAAALGGSVGAPSQGSSPGTGQPAAGAAARAAAAAAADAEAEGSEEGRSRRWTEGSASTAADEQQQLVGGGTDLAAALQALSLSSEDHQQQQQRRPSRRAQVSPHCPPALEAAEHSGAATPPEQLVSASAAAAAAAEPTPFFTPAGLSSAVGTPATHSRTQAWEEGAQATQQDGGGICRALEGSLEAADAPGGPAAAADAPAAEAAASPEAAQLPPRSAAGSRSGSRSASRVQRQTPGGYSSDTESYLSASSSAALLPLPLLESPTLCAAAPQSARARSASGTALAGPGPAPGSRLESTAAAEADVVQQQQEEQQQEQLPPLLQLDDEALVAHEVRQAAPEPLLQLDDSPAATPPPQVPLLQLETLLAAEQHPQQAAEQQQRAEQTQLPAEQELEAPEQRGSGPVGVRVVLRSVSSSSPWPVLGTAGGSLCPSPGEEQAQQAQQAAAGPDAGVEDATEPAAVAGQEVEGGGGGGGGARHEVVRVTATNLDMSRPLRSSDLLHVYRASVVPAPGQVFEFQPDPGLQTICFQRPNLEDAIRGLGLRPNAASLPDIDAAQNLGGWAVAALCRSMSLDSILSFLTAALLERQMVVFCPNAGLLSGIVLSLVPLLLPFHWQCLLLPVLPAGEGRLELLEAPVPFVLGILYKTPEVRAKCGSLVRVNVYKDKVKNHGGLPPLPQHDAIKTALSGSYSTLREIGLTRTAMTRPVHMVTETQQRAAQAFLATLQAYLKGTMADLRAYCITDVSPAMERTSVLLKDSFVDSFPPRDRPFMRQFAETQMFSVYTDAVLG